MSYKYEDVFGLMQTTAIGVVKDTDSWKDFLNTAAMNYKRPFYNQLLIFNQKPEATACATFDYWNQKMGRFVKKGSKGIVTLDPASQRKEILFDISDTGSNNDVKVPVWAVTSDMYALLGTTLQEHFETGGTNGDLVAVLFEAGAQAVEGVLPQVVSTIQECRDNSLLAEFDEINLTKIVKETLTESVVYMLLKRCDLQPEDYVEDFKFSYIKHFNIYDTIAVLGSFLNNVSKPLFKDISLAVRSIEKTLDLRKNVDKEENTNEFSLQDTRGLSNPEHIRSEAADGDREVRDNAENLLDGREGMGVHRDDVEGHIKPTLERDQRESDGNGSSFDSTDGADGRRERDLEGEGPHEVDQDDEQFPTLGRGDSESRADLRLNDELHDVVTVALDDDSEGKDGKQPDLPLEYVLTNVLQHHRFLKKTGAEIQNYFIDGFEENEKIAFLRDVYNQDYTEIITPGDEYRVGYHASENGLEVWTGAYLGSTSRVVVPWSVVVNAVDILIKQDEYLTVSEKVEIPTVEQQVLFAEEAEAQNTALNAVGMVLPQQVIDEVICSGSNNRDSVLNICAHYKRNYSVDENVKFLAKEYGAKTGKGFIIDGDRYSVLFEEKGIRVAEGNSVTEADNTAFLSWNAIDKRIKELLALGRYISPVNYGEVEDKLLTNTANLFWETCSIVRRLEAVDTLQLNTFGELLSSDLHRKGFPEMTAQMKEILAQPEKVKALLWETKLLMNACVGENPVLRVRGYEFACLGDVVSLLDTLSREVQEYPVENSFEPSYKAFITDDEVDIELIGGSSFQDGKYRIYKYFLEPHPAVERANFLKDEYGTGGHSHALGGVEGAQQDHNSKGIVLSRGDIFKPYDTVNLSWNVVAKKIDKLIRDGRYLSQKELEHIPEYEKDYIATGIRNFFDRLPLEVKRPFSLGDDDKDIVESIVKQMDADENRTFEKNVLVAMKLHMASMDKDDYHYNYRANAVKLLERYAEGVSMFDIEARKRRGEWDKQPEEPQVVPAEVSVQAVQENELPVNNAAYAYDVKPGDVVFIDDGRFEVVSMDETEVVLNDVDFPLFTETYSLEDFNQKIKINISNAIYRVPIENIAVNEIGDDEHPYVEVSGVEVDDASAESPVSEVSEALPSEEPVYRYYFNLKHPDDGYPSYEDNPPLNVAAFENRRLIEDFGIWSSGYVEYAKPLSVDDLNKFDLMLYNPPIVSRDTLKAYSLGFGHLGNGTTVWNRLEEEAGDYKTVAHISPEGEITFYDKEMPQEAIDKIQAMADKDKAAWEEKLRIAAEAMAEVEKRYGSPFAQSQPEKKTINRRTIPCRNYIALKKFAEDVLNGKYTYMRFERDGYEPLYVELIDKNTIAMAHTFVQNGDLCYDPEMVITFDNEKEELQACSYELSLAGLYQRVDDGSGRVNLGLQRELNSFLNTWLKNINEQDRALVRVVDRDGNEIDFTTNKVEEIVPEVVAAGEREVTATPNVFSADDRFTYNGEEFVVKDADGPLEDMDEVLLVSTLNPEKALVTTYGALRGVIEAAKQAESVEQEVTPEVVDDSIEPDINERVVEAKPQNRGFDFDEYLKVKDLYPDDLVAYQIGDFYEFLGEDAEKVAKELGVVLTSRDVGLAERMAMCGVPAFRFQGFMETLIQNGYNVAVHGFDEKVGRRVTVDFESNVHAFDNSDASAPTSDIAEEDKLIIQPHKQPDGAPYNRPIARPRGVGIDYRIEHLEQGSKSPKERFKDNVAAIRTLKNLEVQERLAEPNEQAVLARYVGWGGLSDAFDESKSAWASEYSELKELLTPEEYASARSSTLTAFYTSPEIIQFMYKTLENMGFKKGNILEPSCGVGNFIGMLPDNLADSKVYGVELDSISGRIAQQLYQKQDIRIQGFEKTDFPDSFFDVAIGNVPFGQFKLNDKKYDKNNFLIHDYFFAKALDKVRPGGVVAFITSKGTLDKENSAVRKYLAERAEFLGAVRLPDNAFKANAGTEVTSDIIFLQKREKPIEIDANSMDWLDLAYLTDENTGEIIEAPNGETMTVNSYFASHPENVLGKMVVESTQYGYDTTCKAIEGKSLAEQLNNVRIEAVRDIGERSYEEQENTLDSIPADPTVRNFSYTLVDGNVYYRVNSEMFPSEFKSEMAENRVRGLIALRDCVRTLISMQMENDSETAIIKQRELLNTLYDEFSKKYGLINSVANKRLFQNDGSYYLLASLENLDENDQLKSKADIFYKRTIKPHIAVSHVDTSTEALGVSISEKACVDIPFMMELSSKTAEEIERDLIGVIFRVPGQKTPEGEPVFVTADEYLSGNVREKLRIAKNHATFNELYRSNVEALEKVQPRDLDASEISVRLGSTWIPKEYIDAFMYELLDTPYWAKSDSYFAIKTKFAPVTGEWFIENKAQDKYNVKANVEFGTERRTAYQIIEDTLNLRDTRVYDYVEDENGKKKAVLNREETAIAQQKQEVIKETFVEWLWRDPNRREYLTTYYNEHFNNIRPREYDGSHLRFGGINPEIELRKHQLNAIARIIYGGNTLLAHAVGAGKTFEMVAAAQESKRLGLCNKSLFVVPNHLVEQFAADYMKLYPSANILCSTNQDFSTANRKKFCSRIATGDYDAIIIGQSQFERIPMSTEGQRRAIQEQLNDVMQGITELKSSHNERFSVKQLEKTKKNLEAKLEKLNNEDRKDDVITFEELGVDRLFIDEAHYFKNLFLYTKMRSVAGLGSRDAQRATDLFMKCRYMDKLTDGKGVIFATGTPVSNSMTELYTMQRYLQYDKLCEMGLQHFDSWASTFGETVTAIELAPEGRGYRAKTRFARFHNLPELMSTFKEIADVQTADMLHLPVPKANFHVVDLQPSEIQKELVQGLADRATAIHEKRVKPTEDNMLLVTNDGRKLALDQRLIDPLFADDSDSKINACANNVFEIWEKSAPIKGTQIVFCDLSTPKSGDEFDVYNDLKDKLVAKGIPKNEIAFIHNANTRNQKIDMFEKMRKGKIRVLLGSTSKLGVGSNVQDRLVAMHDIDCPWRPADLEQRLGRIVRQGNTNDEVDIFRYVTKDTFDAYCWQLIENKQNFISQIITSKSPSRSAEDIDEAVLSYAEIKSLATGDPRIKEKMDLDVAVKRLKLLKQSFLREKYALEDKVLKQFPKDIAHYTDAIAKCKKDVAVLNAHTSTDKDYFFPMTVAGTVYTEKDKAGEAILEFCHQKVKMQEEPLGEYRGFKMFIEYNKWTQTVKLTLKNELRYSIELGKDKFGNITRINNALNSLPERLVEYESKLESTHTQMENAKKQMGKSFAHEQELKSKSARLDQLNIELSLDKNDSIDIASSFDEKQVVANQKAPTRFDER